MKNNNDFCICILSYKRADNLHTYKTLREQGFSGKIYIICSTDDDTIDEYRQKYENVLVFNKEKYVGTFDIGDNFPERNTVIYARNAVFDLMKENNEEYFIVLDDDYTVFRYSTMPDGSYMKKGNKIKDCDYIFSLLVNYYKSINAKTLAIAQGGDFIGGELSGLFKKRIGRKAMNFFICSTKRRFNYIGRANDDVNTYVRLGELGNIFLTVVDIRLEQKPTQKNKGGLTEMYLDAGTYIKSFYSILFHPSAVKVSVMGGAHKRLHHMITWKYAVPCIIDQKYK